MNNRSASSRVALSEKTVSPIAAITAVVVVVTICLVAGYMWMNQPEVSTSVQISTARHFVEQPERDKLKAQGMAAAEVDKRIDAMWRRGELKMPRGEVNVDWAATPNGIVPLAKGPGGRPR
jgi:hypothetical protein